MLFPLSDAQYSPLAGEAADVPLFQEDGTPHPLARQAAARLQDYILAHPAVRAAADEGKMFGVLVVRPAATDSLSFLAAYSGLLGGRNDWPDFVPPVFDAQQADGHFKQQERAISAINHEAERLERSDELALLRADVAEAERQAAESVALYNNKVREAKALRDMLRQQRNLAPEEEERLRRESQFMKAELHRIKKRGQAAVEERKARLGRLTERIGRLKEQRRQMSEELQQWLFAQYRMTNARGERCTLLDIFEGLPPAGSGDCCAPKLLQYALTEGLKPVCLAEFWWGAAPKAEIRHHLHFYPPCRGKCQPILRWMLPGAGADAHRSPGEDSAGRAALRILYEDSYLAVVSKPAGLLSVPGKTGAPSVEQLMRLRWHDDTTPIIVHRLDMETSGVMVVARTKWAHSELQRQFAQHEVTKRYEAILDGPWPEGRPAEGIVSLPLRPDIDDRPRQLVDPHWGKEARTRYVVATRPEDALTLHAPRGGAESGAYTAMMLFPLTGRTHQLRVHCAHPAGLGIPIVGDRLYGRPADRLYLHAAELRFRHPKTGELLTFTASA